MLRIAPAVALAALVAVSPLAAAAVQTFEFSHSFDATGYGSASSGTPTGLGFRDFEIFITDSLEDEIFRVSDAQPHNELGSWGTDPMSCALSAVPANCTPSAETALDVRDIAWDGQSLWLVDRDTAGGTTWLIELDSNANMLRRIDANTSGAAPGGLGYDERGSRGLVSTDTGSDFVNHFDLDGNLLGISAIGSWSGAPTGITHFGGDLFLVSDPGAAGRILEFDLVAGGGAASFGGASNLTGFDISTLTNIESIVYDVPTFTLYVLDTPSVNSSSVYVFHHVIPEPGTALLLASGLVALGLVGPGARRRQA